MIVICSFFLLSTGMKSSGNVNQYDMQLQHIRKYMEVLEVDSLKKTS